MREKKLEVTIFKQGCLKGLENKVGFLKFLIVLSDLHPNLAHSCLGQVGGKRLWKDETLSPPIWQSWKNKKKKKSLGKVLQIYRHLLNLSWDAHTWHNIKNLKINILGHEMKEDNKNSWAQQLVAWFLFPILWLCQCGYHLQSDLAKFGHIY